MKKILTAAAALLFSVAMFAQSNDSPPPGNAPAGGNPQMRQQRPPMTPEQRAKRETDQINSMVALGDKYGKVLDVNTQTAQKRESIMGGAKRNEMTDAQKAQLKQLNEEHKKNLEAAMGPELYAKYKEAERARRESHAGGQQAPPPGDNK